MLIGQDLNGIVLDINSKKPIENVLISINDGEQFIVTDEDGIFSQSNVLMPSKLNFNAVGYEETSYIWYGKAKIEILLNQSITTLDEIIVTGYGGESNPFQLNGSVASAKEEEISKNPVTSFESALQGRLAGVAITKESGKLGQAIRVRVRGTASITGNNEPLYVLDGIVLTSESQSLNGAFANPLAGINFDDIASIDILKDASSAAIYGSRASNGVVLISTKKGAQGNSKIHLDVARGFSEPSNLRDFMNAEEYLELFDEAFNNVADQNGRVNGQSINQWKDRFIPRWDEGSDTDWELQAFNQDAGILKTNLSFNGGNDKTSYYISGAYWDEEGILINDRLERISARMNLNQSIRKNFNLGINLNVSRTINKRLPIDNQFATPLQLSALPPVQPILDRSVNNALFEETLYFNSLLFSDNARFKTTSYRTLGNVYFQLDLLPNLFIRSEAGLDNLNQEEDLFFGSNVFRVTGENDGLGINSRLNTFNYTINNFVNWKPSIGGIDLDLTGGSSFQNSTTSFNQIEGRNFPNDDLNTINSAGDIIGGTQVVTAWALSSFYARLNASSNKKYILNASLRLDGDSRFGENNRFGMFSAASLGWVLSEESFFPKPNWLSHFKLRFSLGQTGNTPRTNFASRPLWGAARYAGQSAILPIQIQNADLKWEVTNQWDAGFNFALFENRIFGSLSFYNK
ncbi:MAG: SusC/RagA family TonB-linked outer membrane protein, partial [Bacteroidota bacterium]